MLLKLVIPYYSRSFQGGVVAKWHKAPGDLVEFGDDLLDIDVPEIRAMKTAGTVQGKIESPAGSSAKEPTRPNGCAHDGQAPAGQRVEYVTKAAAFRMGITSSDVGVLRVILAPEGAACRVGEAIAILSTEADEPADALEEALQRCSTFRAVPNPFIPSA
jgi:hypothetical protein